MQHGPGKAFPAGEGSQQNYILVVATTSRDIYEISMLVQRFGYFVCSAQSGKQALDMAHLMRPSLVISELSLPDMSGLELLRQLSADGRSFPLIVIVPDANEHVEARKFELGGAIPFLVKPISAEDLYRTVQTAIESTPRSSIRIRTTLPVSVNNTLLDCRRGECATYLSAQGMFVRMRKPFREKDRLKVTVNIGSRAVTADASVLYCRKSDKLLTADPGMAVKFTAIRPEDQAFIASYIRNEVTRGISRVEN